MACIQTLRDTHGKLYVFNHAMINACRLVLLATQHAPHARLTYPTSGISSGVVGLNDDMLVELGGVHA